MEPGTVRTPRGGAGLTLFLSLELLFPIFGSGCGTKPLYPWGSYEDLLYRSWIEPGSAPPAEQIDRLVRDLERANSKGQRVPPGVHAHLGYLQYGEGNVTAAIEHFEAEKRAFPESTVFIDGILERLAKQ